jgi:hypothetical protein
MKNTRARDIRPMTLAFLYAFGIAVATLGTIHPAHAESKMAECNTQSKGKTGDDRKAFMSDCLKKKPVTQQDKMKSCNKDATGMKGDDRKTFMKSCLSKH